MLHGTHRQAPVEEALHLVRVAAREHGAQRFNVLAVARPHLLHMSHGDADSQNSVSKNVMRQCQRVTTAWPDLKRGDERRKALHVL